ncbi:acyl-CoA dehydrogenase family protein [Pseudonocardia sp. GCM10023141]|uniref:acyl-CoA dehydrogenase family protein n=1 Tax=Pseudonocardia sp. GCM10023141 TaxID=3252653 RepID=UPI00360F0DCA
MFTDEQEELRAIVRGFLVDRCPEAQVRRFVEDDLGHDPRVWRELGAGLGLQGIGVPEEYGGAGHGIVEQAVVFEELGRANVGLPFLSTVALAENLLLAVGDDAACREHLPGLVDGSRVATVALAEQGCGWDPAGVELQARPSGTGWTLHGEKLYVSDGQAADLLLVVARAPEGLTVLSVDGGYEVTPMRTVDLARRQARLRFDGVPARLIGEPGSAAGAVGRMLDRAVVALACEQVGGARWCLEATVAYAAVREQFGRPIGSFQAVKHACADMLLDVEQAASAAYHAVWAVADAESAGSAAVDAVEIGIAASLAKACCSRAFESVSAQAIHLHGGIGFTWEHPAHLYHRRARASAALFGGAARHLDRMVDLAGPTRVTSTRPPSNVF